MARWLESSAAVSPGVLAGIGKTGFFNSVAVGGGVGSAPATPVAGALAGGLGLSPVAVLMGLLLGVRLIGGTEIVAAWGPVDKLERAGVFRLARLDPVTAPGVLSPQTFNVFNGLTQPSGLVGVSELSPEVVVLAGRG